MTREEEFAQVLCEAAPVTELHSGGWSDLHPVEQGHWIEMARTVLAHLVEIPTTPPARLLTMPQMVDEIVRLDAILREDWGRECNLLAVVHRDGGHYVEEHGPDKASRDAETLVLNERAQAAAHAEDARKIQVRMMVVQDHLRTARHLLKEEWSGKEEWWVGHEHTWSAQADDEIRKAMALLAETDGRCPCSFPHPAHDSCKGIAAFPPSGTP